MHQFLRGAAQVSPNKSGQGYPRAMWVVLGLVGVAVVLALRGGECHHETTTVLPVRHAVAFAIRNPKDPSQVLTVTRPGDDSSLPGVIGLPAGYVPETESFEEAVTKRGLEKLGVNIKPTKFVGRGRTVRQTYVLEMEEFEAVLVDETQVPVVPQPSGVGTQYAAWEWRHPESLKPAADRGSLCSRIYLSSNGIASYKLN